MKNEQTIGAAAGGRALGIVPPRKTTYREACEQGWAPKPANAVQQKVWDEVHAMPTEPMKILPKSKQKR